MNLEKSLDIIKGKLLLIDKMLKQDQEEGHGSAYEMQTEDFEAIETLLTAYEKEKEKNNNARERIEYYLVGNFTLNDFDERNKELRKIEKVLEE